MTSRAYTLLAKRHYDKSNATQTPHLLLLLPLLWPQHRHGRLLACAASRLLSCSPCMCMC
jgi:hypothetical protein